MKQTISVTYYECPICGKNSTSKPEIERDFRQHQIKADEVIYCKICGAGWYVNAYGRIGAEEKARAFFLSKGAFGYVRVEASGDG